MFNFTSKMCYIQSGKYFQSNMVHEYDISLVLFLLENNSLTLAHIISPPYF